MALTIKTVVPPYTVLVSDDEDLLLVDGNSGDIIVPTGLGAGFNCLIQQKGTAGDVNVIGDTGISLLNGQQSKLDLNENNPLAAIVFPLADELKVVGQIAETTAITDIGSAGTGPAVLWTLTWSDSDLIKIFLGVPWFNGETKRIWDDQFLSPDWGYSLSPNSRLFLLPQSPTFFAFAIKGTALGVSVEGQYSFSILSLLSANPISPTVTANFGTSAADHSGSVTWSNGITLAWDKE